MDERERHEAVCRCDGVCWEMRMWIMRASRVCGSAKAKAKKDRPEALSSLQPVLSAVIPQQ
jgi:hypothetical protein